jgi:hypothetical protein
MTSPATQLLLIDNTEGDCETKRIAEEFHARYFVEPHIGLSRTRNQGFAESSCDVVVFLDDNATPDEAWLTRAFLI